MSDDPALKITDTLDIPQTELHFQFSRSGGPGGQHVNRSATQVELSFDVANSPSLNEAQRTRILSVLKSYIDTHGVLHLSSQTTRSQHRNRAEAMAMLKARLYERELNKRNEERQAMEDAKTDIAWGHQIRSYVLDQSRIKDLRTNVEIGNTQAVLDGDLDPFIEASLKQGVGSSTNEAR